MSKPKPLALGLAVLIGACSGGGGGGGTAPPNVVVNSLSPPSLTLVANDREKIVEATYTPADAACEVATSAKRVQLAHSCAAGRGSIRIWASPGVAGLDSVKFCVSQGQSRDCKGSEINVEAVREAEIEMPPELSGVLNGEVAVRPTLARNADQCQFIIEGESTGSYGNPQIIPDQVIPGPGSCEFTYRFGSAVMPGLSANVRFITTVARSSQEDSKPDSARTKIIGLWPVARIDTLASRREYCASNDTFRLRSRTPPTFLTWNRQDHLGTSIGYEVTPQNSYRLNHQSPVEIWDLTSANFSTDRRLMVHVTNNPAAGWQDSMSILIKAGC